MVLVAHRFISVAVKFYSIRFSAYLSKAKNNFWTNGFSRVSRKLLENDSAFEKIP